ncbi:PREDICTED: biotin--protein ligase-like [Acropora digitifera]|uniref:biotin--protein ligase-like n=1 Tax=Acropora digitifera TaxID=70779 RepID=UPI00077A81C8|nr:PREDICTED: biotin--protein ligase-like [Acropora digitifera]
MPLIGAGWLSGYAVTTLFSRSGNLKGFSVYTTPLTAKKLVWTSRARVSNDEEKNAMRGVPTKPPNVLIYSGSEDAKRKVFNLVKETLLQVLHLHSYSIYHLHEKQVHSQPWMENTALLVIGDHDLPSERTHLEQSGTHVFILKGDYTVLVQDVNTRKPVIVQVTEGGGTAVLSLVHLEFINDEEIFHNGGFTISDVNKLNQSKSARIWMLSHVLQILGISCKPGNLPELTPMYLMARNMRLIQSLRTRFGGRVCKGKDLSLHFVPDKECIPKSTENLLPVIIGDQNSKLVSFDWKKYMECLQTKVLGHILLYTEVITSTQVVLDGNNTFVKNIPDDLGIIVVAGQQVKGQGRGGNVWLSPAGCMMFSLHVQFPFESNLGQRLPFLQHIASLAAVEAIKAKPGYEVVDVSLKWPNDIYFGHKIKIGGVIVTSSATGGTLSAVIAPMWHQFLWKLTFHSHWKICTLKRTDGRSKKLEFLKKMQLSCLFFLFNVGMGVNLANGEPTVSINEIISQYNKEHRTFLEPLTIEENIARTF